MISFDQLGCTKQVSKWHKKKAKGLVLGRVTSLDRGYPLVNTESEELRCELSTSIKKSDDSIVAVGDWVGLNIPKSHEKAIIEAIMPREVEIARVKRVGRENQVRRQVLAANVDRVFLCQSLTGEGLDLPLSARQMAAACGCGSHPVFVLTKADAVSQSVLNQALDTLKALAPDVPILVLAAIGGEGVDQVRALCEPNTTSLLLGESGVGKSTLVNALLGSEALATAEVRASDDRGRHTTVARRMLQIPGAGLIIDAPGLRTLQILDLERSLRRTFPDIDQLRLGCRFNDCTHTHEPGCNVRDEVNPVRLEAFLQLSQQALRN